jgi:predicted NUDIX family NTP pyrophosphohydrolase
VAEGAFVPNHEVDAVGWFDLASARAILSYQRDVVLVDEIERATVSSTITP